MRVSVIIPSRNRLEYLPQALHSALSQQHRDVEVIVVDDGSDTPLSQLAPRFPEVTFLRQDATGVSAARNLGIEHASGDLLTFLDSDDLWDPDKITRQMEQLAKPDAGADFVLTKYINFLEEGHPMPSHLTPADFGVPMPCIMSMLGSRERFMKVGLFNTKYDHGEDTEWMLRARDAGMKLVEIDGGYVRRRIHDTNLTFDIKQSRANAMEMLRASMRRKRQQQKSADES